MTRDEINYMRDLEAEVAELKDRLKAITGGSEEEKFSLLGLTKSEERVMRVLMIREVATHEAIEAALYWDKHDVADSKTVQVFLTRIRQKLPYIAAYIKSISGRGYHLQPEGKHRLMFELRNPGAAQQYVPGMITSMETAE